jgi:penicillin-binding protein 1B
MHLLHYGLRAVMQEGTGRGAYKHLSQDFKVAGNTGTTNDGRDSWFAGFTGDLMAVTWIGRDDNGGTGLTGGSGALKVWSHFMARAGQRSLGYRMPDGIETHWVDGSSGFVTGQGCPNSRMLPFIAGSQPRDKTSCSPQKSGIKDWFQSLFGD